MLPQFQRENDQIDPVYQVQSCRVGLQVQNFEKIILEAERIFLRVFFQGMNSLMTIPRVAKLPVYFFAHGLNFECYRLKCHLIV